MPKQERPLVSWLHQQGLAGTESADLLRGLCDQLVGSGIEIDRAVLGFLVYHPQFDGLNFVWDSRTRRVQREAVTRSEILRGPSPFLEMQTTGLQEIRLQLGEVAPRFPLLTRLNDLGFTDYFAFLKPFGTAIDNKLWLELPDGMVLHEGVYGSFATRQPGGFEDGHVEDLREVLSPLAVAVKVGAVLEMAETLLGAYLGTATGRSVMRGLVRRGQGRVIDAVIWHSDMRGSSDLAQSAALSLYLDTLNSYYDCVVAAVTDHGGEVLKFIGDGVLAIFPVETGSGGGTEASRHAVAAAGAALARLDRVNAARSELGLAAIRFGIGLHAGQVMYGNVGSAQRLDFTVTGPAVNEVVRLEALCKQFDIPLVVSEVVAAFYDQPLAFLERHVLPGTGCELAVFSLPELVPQR